VGKFTKGVYEAIATNEEDCGNAPIFLSGDNTIDYKVISQFMNTKSKKVAVDKSLVENFQREQQGEEINRNQMID
jgi:hypothetical protein